MRWSLRILWFLTGVVVSATVFGLVWEIMK